MIVSNDGGTRSLGTPRQQAAVAFCEKMGYPAFSGKTYPELCDYLSRYLNKAKDEVFYSDLVMDINNEDAGDRD